MEDCALFCVFLLLSHLFTCFMTCNRFLSLTFVFFFIHNTSFVSNPLCLSISYIFWWNIVKFYKNSKPLKAFWLECTFIHSNIDRCPIPRYFWFFAVNLLQKYLRTCTWNSIKLTILLVVLFVSDPCFAVTFNRSINICL